VTGVQTCALPILDYLVTRNAEAPIILEQASRCRRSSIDILFHKLENFIIGAISSVGRVKPLSSSNLLLCAGLRGVRASSNNLATRRASLSNNMLFRSSASRVVEDSSSGGRAKPLTSTNLLPCAGLRGVRASSNNLTTRRASLSNNMLFHKSANFIIGAISSVGRVKPLSSSNLLLCAGLRGVRASSNNLATRRASLSNNMLFHKSANFIIGAISSVGRVKPLSSSNLLPCAGLRGVPTSSYSHITRRASLSNNMLFHKSANFIIGAISSVGRASDF